MLTKCADFLNFLTFSMIFAGSASPITVTVFFDGSRTMEVMPSMVATNFITLSLHFEHSSSTDTTVFCNRESAVRSCSDSDSQKQSIYELEKVLLFRATRELHREMSHSEITCTTTKGITYSSKMTRLETKGEKEKPLTWLLTNGARY